MTIATDYIEGIEDNVNDLLDAESDSEFKMWEGATNTTTYYFVDGSKLIVNAYNDMSAE